MTLVDQILLWTIFGGFAGAFVFFFLIRSARWGLIPVGLCMTAAGVGLFIALAGQLHVALFGVDTDGVIEEIKSARRTSHVIVRFTTSSGEVSHFRCRQGVQRNTYNVGEAVPVRYLTSDPAQATIANRRSMYQPLTFGAVFSLAPLVVAGLIFRKPIQRWGQAGRPRMDRTLS